MGVVTRRAAAFLVAALVATVPALAQEAGFVPIDIGARRIESFSFNSDQPGWVGSIEFRGGLSLSSSNEHFGAISGLDIGPDGRLIAILDTGFWLTARLIEEDGRLVGISDGMLAPILDEDGEPASRKVSADAEGLRVDRDRGLAFVSFEQDHRVAAFDLADLSMARPMLQALPQLRGLSGNRGIEAVAIAPPAGILGGALVLISETAGDSAGITGWIVGGSTPGEFAVRRNGAFDVTDAAFLPNGDLMILERQFSLSAGVAMRIRRISSADIRPDRIANGPTVMTDGNLFQIDNMEGLALRPQPSGEVLIDVVSDDNHNILQRTLLLQFAWRDDQPPLPVWRPSEAAPNAAPPA